MTLSVTADSGSFQWLFNGSPISGATGATLTLPTMTVALAGNYSVTVTNETGAVTTSPATLTVTPATSFAHWQNVKFSAAQLADPLVSGATADPVKSGTVNLLKYAFNGNPFSADAALLPIVATERNVIDGQTYLTFTFFKRSTGRHRRWTGVPRRKTAENGPPRHCPRSAKPGWLRSTRK